MKINVNRSTPPQLLFASTPPYKLFFFTDGNNTFVGFRNVIGGYYYFNLLDGSLYFNPSWPPQYIILGMVNEAIFS